MLLVCILQGQAQNTTIKGRVADGQDKGIEVCNVYLLKAIDTSMIDFTLSDESGQYIFNSVQADDYFIKVSHIVYSDTMTAMFHLSDSETKTIDIAILDASHALNEVTVVAQKPFLERQMDKLVVNVENSILATGNTVLDILQRSPGVMVNQESSINMKGKSGVMVMIDGKPSPLSGPELIAYLRSVPSENIKSIELISNPSAKYDAAGNAGIINIRFKKDQRLGFNGSASLSSGKGMFYKHTAATNLNYRNQWVNVFGSYSRGLPTQLTEFFIHRNFFDAQRNVISGFDQNSFMKQPFKTHNVRLGIDFNIGKKTVLGILTNSNFMIQNRTGNTETNVTDASGTLDYITNTNMLMDEDRDNTFYNLNFKHSFTNNAEWTADVDYGTISAATIQNINNSNSNVNNQIISSNKLFTDQLGSIDVRSFKSDFTKTFGPQMKFETGIKLSKVGSDNDVKFFNVVDNENIPDVNNTNHFIYDETITAAYAMFMKEYTKFSFQGGLRYEHTSTAGNQLSTGQQFERNYGSLFPNLTLNWKENDAHIFGLTYSKRIDRPSYRQLNPFKIFVDTYTYVVGDPALKPVITHNFEFSHTFKGKYITSLSYAESKETITDIFAQDDDTKISYQIPANIQDFQMVNLSFYIPFTFAKVINSNFSANGYWNKYVSPLQGGLLTNSNFAYDFGMQNNISFGKGWSGETSAFYQARSVWGLFIIKDLGQLSLGVQKVVNNKNTTLKLAFSDILKTNHIAVEVDYQNMDFYTDRTWDSRVATLSINHRFGKNTVARSRQRTTGVEDEKRRAG